MFDIKVRLPQKGQFNSNEIHTMLTYITEDMSKCKKDLQLMRNKPYWDKIFQGKSLQLADRLVYQNDGILLFINIIHSIFRQHFEQIIKFTDIDNKFTSHILLVTSLQADFERYSKSAKAASNNYTDIALEFLSQYLERIKAIKQEIAVTPKDDPAFSLENLVLEKLKTCIGSISMELNSKYHDEISVDVPEKFRKAIEKEKPLKQPGVNHEFTLLIAKLEEQFNRDLERINERLQDTRNTLQQQQKAINFLRNQSNSKNLAVIAIIIGIVATVVGIMGIIT